MNRRADAAAGDELIHRGQRTVCRIFLQRCRILMGTVLDWSADGDTRRTYAADSEVKA